MPSSSKSMFWSDALQQCPDLALCDGEDLTPFREASRAMTALILKRYPLCERIGMEEVRCVLWNVPFKSQSAHRVPAASFPWT
jgi:hypothetical protein